MQSEKGYLVPLMVKSTVFASKSINTPTRRRLEHGPSHFPFFFVFARRVLCVLWRVAVDWRVHSRVSKRLSKRRNQQQQWFVTQCDKHKPQEGPIPTKPLAGLWPARHENSRGTMPTHTSQLFRSICTSKYRRPPE